jgi:Ca2+-binding EF-hand superfamily protein
MQQPSGVSSVYSPRVAYRPSRPPKQIIDKRARPPPPAVLDFDRYVAPAGRYYVPPSGMPYSSYAPNVTTTTPYYIPPPNAPYTTAPVSAPVYAPVSAPMYAPASSVIGRQYVSTSTSPTTQYYTPHVTAPMMAPGVACYAPVSTPAYSIPTAPVYSTPSLIPPLTNMAPHQYQVLQNSEPPTKPLMFTTPDPCQPVPQQFRVVTASRTRPKAAGQSQASMYANQYGGYQQQTQPAQQQGYDASQQQGYDNSQQQYSQDQQQYYSQQQQQYYSDQQQQQQQFSQYQQYPPQQQGYAQEQQQLQQDGSQQYDIPPLDADTTPHLTREEKERKAHAIFKKYDKDGNGFLDIYEFLQAMNNVGANLTYDDAKGIFAAFDESNQNCISIDNFVATFVLNLN